MEVMSKCRNRAFNKRLTSRSTEDSCTVVYKTVQEYGQRPRDGSQYSMFGKCSIFGCGVNITVQN